MYFINLFSSLQRKSESGSDVAAAAAAAAVADKSRSQELMRIVTTTLTKSESFSGQTNLAEDLSLALSMLTLPRKNNRRNISSTSEMDSDDDATAASMTKPNFRLGAPYTTTNNGYAAVGGGASKLGSLAALATYNTEKDGKRLQYFSRRIQFSRIFHRRSERFKFHRHRQQ